ncbi:type II secretion system protein [Oscillatoria sp. FACHB-1407]|uniref:pilus assembly FimT family protein n=1 Tax=Oscillatoria sp. FACHB-1407 TaxID=2692847 RepID=UPI001689798B|nr:type II secretion system protein [Oscillatoria sp. FACHB-1407]MBD2464214.1 type II secretion system protein [Oscillatoria sp. FACHB-1407]
MHNRFTVTRAVQFLVTNPFRSTSGFTLAEMAVVIGVLGILAAIAIPSWLAFRNTRNLNVAQGQIYQILSQTQGEAARLRADRRASFREQNGVVQWAIHSTTSAPSPAEWQTLSSNVRIDPIETTLANVGGAYQVRFDQWGNVEGQLGRLTVMGHTGGRARRCVIVSTLLGAMRRGSDHTTPQDGRFCY